MVKKRQASVIQKISRRSYFVSLIISIVGLLSLALLVWNNKINEKERMNCNLVHALMGAQIKVATSHVWFEEAISGDTTVDVEKIWSDIEGAIGLTEAILTGGEPERGLILDPLRDSDLRKRTGDLKSLLIKFKEIGHQRFQDPKAGAVGSVLDDRFDEVFGKFQDKALSLQTIIEEEQTRDKIKSQRLFFGFSLVWISIVAASAIGLWTREVGRRHAEEALQKGKDQLEITVAERTKELRNLNDQLELELHERRRAENELRKSQEQLRYLSSQLLTAQENERMRISGDLHDGLGQELASLKHQLYRVQTKVKEGKMELGNECEESLRNVAYIIEYVRRFSRDLSSHTLEYCGLSAALRSLVDDFMNNCDLDVTYDVIDMDHLVPKKAHIVIYRIFQEVLNNIGKHAQATQLSVIARREDSRISFFFEDNGKGFDVNHTILGNATGKGLGLAILNERVRMLGGSLDLHSEEAKGTRVSFTIPAG